MNYYRVGFTLWVCIQLFLGCSSDMPISGAGGQTTNGLTASIVYSNGNAGANLPFRVRSSDFVTELQQDTAFTPGRLYNGMTDSSGVLTVDSLEAGSYLIEVYDGKGLAVVFKHQTADSGGNIVDGTNTLVPTGSVYGHLSPEKLETGDWYMQIYGLERLAAVDSANGAFQFNDLPAGVYRFRLIAADSVNTPSDIDNITIGSNEIVPLAIYQGWSHSATLTLNTTTSGAAVQEMVTDFPVLIRLTQDNFIFSQSKELGDDIRCTKVDGSPLVFVIEHWDSANRQAEIWVKIDSVHGDNNQQYFMLHWGNPNAQDLSDGASVFDTAAGFAGVWHLNETIGMTQANDATVHNFHGTYQGALPETQASPLGLAQLLTVPDSDYIDMGDVLDPETDQMSISIWVRCSVVSDGPQALVSKTSGDLPDSSYGYQLSIDPGYFPHFIIASGGSAWGDAGTFQIEGTQAIDDSTTWYHLFVVIDRTDASRCKMYVNGFDCTKITGDISSVAAVTNNLPLRIGTESDNNASYTGAFDEVVIASSTRSAAWVLLCYMNQNERDALVEW